MFHVDTCEYKVKYTIENKHKQSYLKQRNKFLKLIKLTKKNISSFFQKLFEKRYVQKENYIEFEIFK